MVRVLRVVAAAAASLALLIGVPWALLATVGNPADRLGDLVAGDVNTQVILAAFAAVLWLAWAQFAVAFAVELVSALRRAPVPRRIPGVFTFQQGLARALVNAALLVLPLAVSSVVPAAQAIAMASMSAQPGAGDHDIGDRFDRVKRRCRTGGTDGDAAGAGDRGRGPHLVGPRRSAPRRSDPLARAVER